jgi:ribosomal-protein-alanine N-acetyltransferase
MTNRNFSPFPRLTTERLTLRELTSNDEHEIFTLRSDQQVNKYLGRQIAQTIDDARIFINKVNENIAKNDSLYWAITFKREKVLIGTICLFSFSEIDNTCEIGYELLPNFQRQGIMKEAAESVIDYALSTIKVQKIEAFFHKDNQSSISLLEKLSFMDSNEPDKTDPDLVYYHLINPLENLK